MTFAAGCKKFDDSAIWDKLNSFESRIAALEQLCSQMNTNISSLQLVVEALQNRDYVTNIAPVTEDGKTIGYTITFSKSGSITIYHGQDGKDGINGVDGTTPVIGVKKYNGVYYWTLDGEWLLDDDGKKIKAEGRDGHNGDDGTNGKNGITPKLKIENEYWYVSYDNGSTWTNLGKATSDSSNSGSSNEIITDVTYDDNCVYITLADGTELIVPRYITSQILYTATAKIASPRLENTVISNEWDSTTGKGVITINGEISILDSHAFAGYSTLTGITIPNSVVMIGDYAFDECESLKDVNIPNSVTSIESGVFYGCVSLESITIPDSVVSIGSNAFSNCESLSNINIPDGVTEIEEDLFNCCTSLTSITIPDGVTYIGGYAFYKCIQKP